MVEERPEEKEQRPSYLDEVRKEREALEKLRGENLRTVNEMRELRAQEILGGSTSAGQTQQRPVEISPKEYVKLLESGKIKLDPVV